jgi:hypothetical protein
MQPKLNALLDFWNLKRAGRRMPARKDFDVFELRDWLGYLHLVQIVDGGEDFLHVIYGSDIALIHGLDLTGKKLDAIPAARRESVRRAYAAACKSRAPLFIEDDPVLQSSLERVENLILPLSSDGRVVDRLLIGAAPVERARAIEWQPPERRRAPRIAILSSGMLQIGEEQEGCVVLDYSAAGARLQLDRPVVLADPVIITFDEFPPRPARIVWQGEGRAGVKFAEAW